MYVHKYTIRARRRIDWHPSNSLGKWLKLNSAKINHMIPKTSLQVFMSLNKLRNLSLDFTQFGSGRRRKRRNWLIAQTKDWTRGRSVVFEERKLLSNRTKSGSKCFSGLFCNTTGSNRIKIYETWEVSGKWGFQGSNFRIHFKSMCWGRKKSIIHYTLHLLNWTKSLFCSCESVAWRVSAINNLTQTISFQAERSETSISPGSQPMLYLKFKPPSPKNEPDRLKNVFLRQHLYVTFQLKHKCCQSKNREEGEGNLGRKRKPLQHHPLESKEILWKIMTGEPSLKMEDTCFCGGWDGFSWLLQKRR